MVDSVLCNSLNSSVVVTDGRVAHPKNWIAVLVKMNAEKKVSARLNAMGLENYVPVQREIRRWSDRNKVIDRVVIPMVVFVKVDLCDESLLRTCSFIHKILSYPGQKKPAVIPEEQIETFTQKLQSQGLTVTYFPQPDKKHGYFIPEVRQSMHSFIKFHILKKE